MEVRLLHPSNALSPMFETLLGMLIDVKPEQPANALLAILIIPLGMVVF